MMFRVNRNELQTLSRVRLVEAEALLKLGHADGAYYLAGYAVEFALKACIAKETKRHDFPDRRRVNSSHTHDLAELVKIAELEGLRQQAVKADPIFQKYWDNVQSWSEQSRYAKNSPVSARSLIEAITNRNHGVMKWVKHYW
jgi:HEPN domain-containing protein